MSAVVLRMGTHAEKEYVQKLGKFFDGLVLGANLLEATPGATASLVVGTPDTPYYIDPMTYAFGEYVDRNGLLRNDLDWIQSDQTVKVDGRKKHIRDFKRSYKKLAAALGSVFDDALSSGKALAPLDFTEQSKVKDVAECVVNYQRERVAQELASDTDLAELLDGVVPPPQVVFAPYFYLEPSKRSEWFDANCSLMRAAAEVEPADPPVHGILCADVSVLDDPDFISRIVEEVPATGVKGLWLWLSGFFEDQASELRLKALKDLVGDLSLYFPVSNMHGGYFSLVLPGMSHISHGIGYGEQKDVVPVIGQSTPMVRYYLPAVHQRLGVPNIERCFDDLEIHVPADFHEKVCDCVVCRGVVVSSLSEFSAFGETHYSRPTSKRRAQTPAAAKRCRMHFLLSRIKERNHLRDEGIDGALVELEAANATWGALSQARQFSAHLPRWIKILKGSG